MVTASLVKWILFRYIYLKHVFDSELLGAGEGEGEGGRMPESPIQSCLHYPLRKEGTMLEY